MRLKLRLIGDIRKKLFWRKIGVDRIFVESYNLETFQNGPEKVRGAILIKDKRQRLELHPDQGWKAMQGGCVFSRGTTPN